MVDVPLHVILSTCAIWQVSSLPNLASVVSMSMMFAVSLITARFSKAPP